MYDDNKHPCRILLEELMLRTYHHSIAVLMRDLYTVPDDLDQFILEAH